MGDPLEARRAALEAQHRRLAGLRRAVSGDVLDELDLVPRAPAVDRDPGGGGTEVEDRDRDEADLEQLDQQLRDVDDAIGRLDRGEYGFCEVWGGPIGVARLEALPATRFCICHQALAERRVGRAGVPAGAGGPVSLP